MRAPAAGPGASGRLLRTARVLLAVVLLVALSGCVQVRQDLRVDPDGTVSGSLRWGVDRRLVETGGAGAPELVRASFDAVPDAAGVTVSSYADGGYAGQEISYDEVPLAAFETGGPGDLAFELTPDGLRLRMRSPAERIEALAPATPVAAVPVRAEAARSGEAATDLAADVHLAVTFPGRVQWHNGTEVRGSTVIWRYRSLAELDAAPARLEAGWDDSGLLAGSLGTGVGPSWRLAGPALAAVVAGVLGAAVVVHRRPVRAAAADPRRRRGRR